MATTGMASVVEIVCPPDRHIPVEFQEIYTLIKSGMSVAERAKFEQIAQLVESLYAQEFMALKRNLKHNFLRFSMGAKDQPYISCVGGGLPTVAELDTAEQKLVCDFLQLMAAARFHILTNAEWELAKADKFLFSLPVEVNWDYYDDRLLKGFWAATAERRALRAELPSLADRVLVFHRGVTVATASGMYTSEKIDLLVEYLITMPLKRLWRRLTRAKAQLAGAKTLTLTESRHTARRVVERRTLRLLMPTVWAVIKNFHKKLKLQEPAFKEVVVLYRAATKQAKHKLPALQRPLEQRQREILHWRNIHIKCFHDIPMADMDVIFADKKVHLKMLTIIQMVVTVVGGLVAAAMVLLQGEKVDMNVLWSSLSLVAARCGQVYTSAQAERSQTIQDMVNILYDKTNDAQEGVLSMLLDDMGEQQLKEAILTYGLLFNREAEMTESMIDSDCERFLTRNFDIPVDFAVEDALPRLEAWGLVRRLQPKGATQPKYDAVHVEEACNSLQTQWHNAFKALSEPPPTPTFPLSNLIAGHDPAKALPAAAATPAAPTANGTSAHAPTAPLQSSVSVKAPAQASSAPGPAPALSTAPSTRAQALQPAAASGALPPAASARLASAPPSAAVPKSALKTSATMPAGGAAAAAAAPAPAPAEGELKKGGIFASFSKKKKA
ncbi:hypothetical protein HYH03_016273 [Edaphochlamys debaryana]|uniref:Uncharacterized protein n=1 Tax=Edaphochlamys debaryana TaxID=47281 RepID=A0A836BRT3_9CHLO|nr:hypothetical protein HYH03_016273 [Edaphochlamys debaryana]|eukprot:KAG2484978.1 hypothetical protein HYH03_016273 [Edaphochlamys debaryana]